jgi:hypothetical protein
MSDAVIVICALALLLVLAVLFRRRWLVVVLGGLVLGPLAYFCTGIWLARSRGIGHFHSVPFGGMSVGDMEIVSSVAVWIVGTGVVIGIAVSVVPWFRGRRRRSHRE